MSVCVCVSLQVVGNDERSPHPSAPFTASLSHSFVAVVV